MKVKFFFYSYWKNGWEGEKYYHWLIHWLNIDLMKIVDPWKYKYGFEFFITALNFGVKLELLVGKNN